MCKYTVSLQKLKSAQKRMESKSLINCRWLNKLDSVVSSRLDVDNYVIILHTSPARSCTSSQSRGRWSRWNIQ